MNVYEEFKELNKRSLHANTPKVTVISTSLQRDLCIVQNKDKTRFLVPIEILMSDVANDMVHINDLNKLKQWSGFEDDAKTSRMKQGTYPSDYFKNRDTYVVEIDNILGKLPLTDLYRMVGEKIPAMDEIEADEMEL